MFRSDYPPEEGRSFKRTMIILAGGRSSRFGQDKGIVALAGKCLASHVYDRVAGIVDEKIVVVRDQQQAESYRKIFPDLDGLVVDSFSPRSALAGMLTGFSHATGKYSIVLPCDSPLVNPRLVDYLFEQAVGSDVAVPRWPYGYIEPLHAVYRVSSSLETGKRVLAEGKNDFRSLIETLRNVLYVPIGSLGSLAPGLKTFFNVNSPEDLEEARRMIEVETLGKQASGDNRR